LFRIEEIFMSEIVYRTPAALPSSASLIKATVVSVLGAGVLLVTTVMPAEYGMDPTGVGSWLGLTELAATTAPETVAPAAAPVAAPLFQSPVWKQTVPFRTDTLTLSLAPDEGAEIKAKMKAGERFVFSWVAEGGIVNFDMHGEPLNAKGDEFTSYWKGMGQSSGHGSFEAPIDGTHGWFWRNRTGDVVTIKATTSGYYESLYQP
jgi:hypothetical protein